MRVTDCGFNSLDMVHGNPALDVSLLPEDLVSYVRLHTTAEVDKLEYILTKQVFIGVKRETD